MTRSRNKIACAVAATATATAIGLSACGALDGLGGDDEARVAAPGVTRAPCPQAVNKKHGCIYLGVITTLSGPFQTIGIPATQAQQAFWRRVNQQGGIGGYDIDVTTYTRDSKYDPAAHQRIFREIKGKVLALAQTAGSPTTAAILEDLRASKVVAVPSSWTSAWEFEDVILESGTSYCLEAMNSVDYAADALKAKSVKAVHYEGDYGADAAAGVEVAARQRHLDYSHATTRPGASEQRPTVDAIVKDKPDLVILTTGPDEAAAIVGQAVKRGYKGRFIGTSPSWHKKLLRGPAGAALRERFLQSAPWKPYAADSPGHSAMRQALGDVAPDDSYTSGWAGSYPLKAVLARAAANQDLTREGVLAAVRQVTRINYEGILPAEAGDFSGNPNTAAFRQTVLGRPDPGEFTGIKVIKDFFSGPTATAYSFDAPCFRKH